MSKYRGQGEIKSKTQAGAGVWIVRARRSVNVTQMHARAALNEVNLSIIYEG